MATFSWKGGDGNWGVPGNWLPPSPDVPNSADATAIINASGTFTVTVETATPYVLNTATLAADGGTLAVQGTLNFNGALDELLLSAGTLELDGSGVIQGATIVADGGVFVATGGTLRGVTFQGDLVLGDAADLVVANGLSVRDASGTQPGTLEFAGFGASLTVRSSETLDGLTINFGGPFATLQIDKGTLTLGAAAITNLSADAGLIAGNLTNQGSIQQTAGFIDIFSVAAGGGFDNQGVVAIGGGTLLLDVDTFSNEGSVNISNGGMLELGLNTTLTNTGALVIDAGGTLGIDKTVTVPELLNAGITSNDGTLALFGMLDLQGGTVTLAASGLFENVLVTDTGTIASGTIVADGGTLTASDGTLAAVTYMGPLTVIEGSLLHATGGLTVVDAAGGSAGTIDINGLANLVVQDGITLGAVGNRGTIQMLSNDSGLAFKSGGTLDHVVLDLAASFDVIAATGDALFLGADLVANLTGDDVEFQGDFVNLGSLAVNAGTTYVEDLVSLDTFTNLSTITIGAATAIVEIGIFTNIGRINIGDGGFLGISADTSLGNPGTITIESGGTLSRQDSTTLSVLSDGGIVSNGGLLQLSGVLDLQGGTLDIAPTGLFSNVDLTGEGTIAHGTILQNGGFFSLSDGTFDDIVYNGVLTLDDNTTLTALEGLKVTDVTGTQAGTIALGFGSELSVSGGLTLALGSDVGVIDMRQDSATINFNDDTTLDQISFMIGGDSAQLFVKSGSLTLGVDTVMELSTSFGFAFGNLVNLGVIQQTTGFFDLLSFNSGDVFDNQNLFSVSNAEFIVDLDNFQNEGTVAIGTGGDLTISSTTTFSSSGVIVIAGGGTLDIETATAASVTFEGAGLLVLEMPNAYTGTLHGLDLGSAIELTGDTVISASITGTTLTANLLGGGEVAYAVDPGLEGAQVLVTEGTDGDQNRLTIACFMAGTRIATSRGLVPVEELRVGDPVQTFAGAMRPIQWIGQRTIDCRSHPTPQAVQPFRVAAHALGRAQPMRDLYLSPDHAVFAEGVLIPIRQLANGKTVRQVTMPRVEYFHIELASHDVLFAEGLAAESYLDTGDRTAFANGGAAIQLHPVFGSSRVDSQLLWDAHGYARLALVGEEVDRVRSALRRRAGSLAPSRAGAPSRPRARRS